MKEISLAMIVKNEEEVIGRCLESVKDIADEIIIVDTGSTDRTKEIVSQYTDRIFDFKWVDDFSKARNFSFSKATKDYIMWLDADDIIMPEDYEKFIELKRKLDGSVDIYMMKYIRQVDKEGNPTWVQERERLLKRQKNYQWVSPIHEVIIPEGRVEHEDICITHKKESVKDTNRNLRIFQNMEKEGVKFDDRQEYCYAKEFYCLGQYEEAIDKYESFLEKYKEEYVTRRHFLYPSIIELSECYKKLGQEEKQLKTLFRIIENEIPTSEFCCRLGDIFRERKDYETSAYWYELALEKSKKIGRGNIGYDDGYYAMICLGICYYWRGDKKKAYEYNEEAGKIRPNDKTYIYNKTIFG